MQEAQRITGSSKSLAVTLPGGAYDSRFRSDKDSSEIIKIPERIRVQTIGGTSNSGTAAYSRAFYPTISEWLEGTLKEPRSIRCARKLNGHSDTASDVLYDHVDPDTLVIAIATIYLDPRAK